MEPMLHEPDIPRTEIVDLVRSHLDELETGQHTTLRLVNLYGIPGLGKSWSINQLYRELHVAYRSVIIRLVRYDQSESNPAVERLPAAELLDRLDRLPLFGGPLTRSVVPSVPQDVIELVGELAPDDTRPLLILVDGAGDVQDWKWFQEALIKPLEYKRVVLVLTSTNKLSWYFWELEQLCQPMPLREFSPPDLRRYLRDAGLDHLEPLSESIYEYTQGYPLAVYDFIGRLKQEHTTHTITPEEVRQLWAALSPGAQELLSSVGLIRLAEVDVISELLRQLRREDLEPQIFTTLTELTRLVKLSKAQPGAPRRIDRQLRQAVALMAPPNTLEAAADPLGRIYLQRAIDKPKSRVHAILEWMYISAPLVAARGDEARAVWERQMRGLFQRATAVNLVDIHTATPALFVLFYRDRELIDRLRAAELYHMVVDQVKEFQAQIGGLRDDSDTLATRIFGVDFDLSCQGVFTELYKRLPADRLPERLRNDVAFTLMMRRLFDPSTAEQKLDELDFRSRVSVATELNPREMRELMTFLIERGFLASKHESYRPNPLIMSLVAFADEKGRSKAMLSVSTNSPQ